MFKSVEMALSPQMLLANVARQRCISKFKELPAFVNEDEKATKTAAVLVPLCVHEGEVCLLYTLRSSNLKSHSGQVSFPGGMMEPNETHIETALRETEEEVGVPRSNVDVWSPMPQVQGRNNLPITPVVGVIKNFNINELQKNPDEVDEIFLVPMKSFCDTRNHAHWEYMGAALPVFIHEKHKIWGITGHMTNLFLNCFLPDTEFKDDFLRKRFDMDELMPAKL